MREHEKAAVQIKQAVPYLRVSNIDQSLAFYMPGLGFEMTNRWIDDGKLRWCWLQLGGAALMLQEFRKQRHDSWKPQCKVGEGVTICFVCDDALALYCQVTANGIQASRPFVGNAIWVTNLSDPDGYQLSFESSTEAPKDTEFSG